MTTNKPPDQTSGLGDHAQGILAGDQTSRTPLQQAGEAADLAREAFAAGDKVTGIAALVLTAQLPQLARLQETINANR